MIDDFDFDIGDNVQFISSTEDKNIKVQVLGVEYILYEKVYVVSCPTKNIYQQVELNLRENVETNERYKTLNGFTSFIANPEELLPLETKEN